MMCFSDMFTHQIGMAIGIFLVSAAIGFQLLRTGLRKQMAKDVWGIPLAGRGWYIVGGLGLVLVSVGCIIFMVLQAMKN